MLQLLEYSVVWLFRSCALKWLTILPISSYVDFLHWWMPRKYEKKRRKVCIFKKIDCENYVVSMVGESVVGMALTDEDQSRLRGKKTCWVSFCLKQIPWILLSTANKMQRYTIFAITVSALHVSGGFWAHHQELKSVHTAPGICQACLLLPLAVTASKLDKYPMLCIQFLSSWWWAQKPPETCWALTVIDNIV